MAAQGSIQKYNSDDVDQVAQMMISCKMDKVANASGIVLYSQWLPVKENSVSDCLSHNHNLSDTQLDTILCFFHS
jgi:hypothetical protein